VPFRPRERVELKEKKRPPFLFHFLSLLPSLLPVQRTLADLRGAERGLEGQEERRWKEALHFWKGRVFFFESEVEVFLFPSLFLNRSIKLKSRELHLLELFSGSLSRESGCVPRSRGSPRPVCVPWRQRLRVAGLVGRLPPPLPRRVRFHRRRRRSPRSSVALSRPRPHPLLLPLPLLRDPSHPQSSWPTSSPAPRPTRSASL